MSPIDRIDQAEDTLNLLRANSIEYSDFEALRNIIELSRIAISNLAKSSGMEKVVADHQSLIKKACYLSELADPDGQQLLPGAQVLQLDIHEFISNPEPNLTVSNDCIEYLEKDLESHLDSLILYFDNSFGNIEAALLKPSFALNTNDSINLEIFKNELSDIDCYDSLTELVELTSGFLGSQTLSRVFSQLFEANRVLFLRKTPFKRLETHFAQQDLLFNAYSEFKLTQGFNLAQSPLASITPVNFSTLKFLVNEPDLMQELINKTTGAIAYSWLLSSLEELMSRYNESMVEDIIAISNHFSAADSDQRQLLDIKYKDHPFYSFFKNTVEIGANGDVDLAYQALNSVLRTHYMQIIKGMMNIFPYDMLVQFEALTYLNPSSKQFIDIFHMLIYKSIEMSHDQATAATEIINLIKGSDNFRKLLSEDLSISLIIH